MTFSDYLQNASDYFTSNTAIHFLPGNHTIKSNEPSHKYNCLLVSDVHNLSLSGYTGVTTLHCIERFGLAFVNATELRISDIKIINCGQTITCTASVLRNNYFVEIPESTKAALTLVNLHSLVLQNVQIQASYGYGLIGVNVLGNSTITNCTFTHNMWRSDDANTSSTLHHSYARPGGNVLLLFTDPESQQFKDALYISQCEFAHGTNTNTFTTATNSLDFPKRIDSCSRVISWGSGLGLLIYKPLVVMKINIINSVFHHNNASYGAGANMFIAFCGTERKSCSIDISNCTFYSGKAVQGGGIYIGSSSGEIAFRLSHSTIINNSAMSGGGLNIEVEQTYSNFRIANCVFSGNKAMQGAAVYIAHYPALWELWEDLGPNTHINVSQTIFLQNIADKSGGGIHINPKDCVLQSWTAIVRVIYTNCSFIENRAESGYAMSIESCYSKSKPYKNLLSIHLFNTEVRNNGRHRYSNGDHCTAVFCIDSTEEVLLSNSTFVGNSGSAVYVNESKLFISGTVKIIDNHGVNGGGLYFDCNPLSRYPQSQSFLYLTPHSQLYMANNTASLHGGAIAAKDWSPLNSHKECFIQISDKGRECSPWSACSDTKIVMENNTAKVAGDSIYGGSLAKCYIQLGTAWMYSNILQVLEIHNKLSLSEVASDPFRVCFCDKRFTMSGSECINEMQDNVFYGQTLQIPAVATGQFNNASPALVQTRIISDMDEIFLGERQNFQELGRDCSPLVYLFDFSRKKVSSFQLHISIEGSSLKTFPAVVNVTVLNCPPGFELSSDLSTCQCEPHLEAYGIRCDIDTQKFTWPAPMWIGYYKEQQVAVHTNCPFHYCRPEDNEFTLDNQDKQCAYNRSGVLCGACQQGLSLALGTSQCLKCSNVYLLLLIPFALAGVVLVFLLLKCNLTVAVGSINGLIFYVNIVQINYATFFPQGAQNMTLLTKFLSIFVAWLNLDLGIQMCFFAGLNAYTKTWLQFVFPVYVWIMVGFMIYGSRYYPTVARLIGSNAVQVLATLFLLSYAKLLRTVIAVFYSTTLVGKNSSTPLVWLLDGNVLFFRGTHIALLVMALVIILLYIVPFTILVLLAPCLQAKSNHTIARLVNIKLKPLLDAYQGPYKDSFRYWTGLMLLVRTILFSAFAGNVLGKPEIDLFAVIVSIVLVVIFYWNSGRVYKKRLWHIAESFYLLNLVILTAATSLLRSLEEPSSSTRQEIVTDVMVGTAFIVFCAIVLYHFCVYVLKTSVTRTNIKQAVQSLLRNKFRNREQPTIGVNPNTSGTPNNIHTVSHLELNLREPLLSVTN